MRAYGPLWANAGKRPGPLGFRWREGLWARAYTAKALAGACRGRARGNALDFGAGLIRLGGQGGGRRAWEMLRAGVRPPQPSTNAFTISLGNPERAMAAEDRQGRPPAAAQDKNSVWRGGDGERDRGRAWAEAGPGNPNSSSMANEAGTRSTLEQNSGRPAGRPASRLTVRTAAPAPGRDGPGTAGPRIRQAGPRVSGDDRTESVTTAPRGAGRERLRWGRQHHPPQARQVRRFDPRALGDGPMTAAGRWGLKIHGGAGHWSRTSAFVGGPAMLLRARRPASFDLRKGHCCGPEGIANGRVVALRPAQHGLSGPIRRFGG